MRCIDLRAGLLLAIAPSYGSIQLEGGQSTHTHTRRSDASIIRRMSIDHPIDTLPTQPLIHTIVSHTIDMARPSPAMNVCITNSCRRDGQPTLMGEWLRRVCIHMYKCMCVRYLGIYLCMYIGVYRRHTNTFVRPQEGRRRGEIQSHPTHHMQVTRLPRTTYTYIHSIDAFRVST